MAAQALWPPVLTSEPEIHGYLTDTSGCAYSRDIGRSFSMGGNLYYIFGDTFCKNKKGEFVGLVSNTVALVRDKTKPLESTYFTTDDKGLVQPFLELNEEEKALEAAEPSKRVTLWSFSGVIETEPQNGFGLVWYEKGIAHTPKDGGQIHLEYLGLGVARVFLDFASGKLRTWRLQGLLFDKHHPRYGSLSALKDGNMIYLYGQKHGSADIVVARVHHTLARDVNAYEHWTGLRYSPRHIGEPATIWSDIVQGAVFRTTMFGRDKVFAAVGVSKWADSKIRVGLSETPHGVWHWHDVAVAKGIDRPDGYMYCIYPHPWAIEEGKALLVTWSEHWPGGVVAARLEFQQTSTD